MKQGTLYRDPAQQYIQKIRSKPKREYAEAYYWFLYRPDQSEPVRPNNLSPMAAQAVRIELRRLIPSYSKRRY